MDNFAEIARTFLDNAAAVQIRNGRDLETTLLELLGDPVRRASLGAAARALVEANRGARTKSLAVLGELLPAENTSNVRPFRVVN
jgi:3-deoxy-D-manno-octulosonic-acid transferase